MTKKDGTACGLMPVLATEQDGLNGKYRHSEVINQLPFEIKLAMPATDRGGRGYSDNLVLELKSHLK